MKSDTRVELENALRSIRDSQRFVSPAICDRPGTVAQHKTIEKYRSNLVPKLGLKTATAVAAYAIAHGCLEI